jgi:hypothetical protein
MIPMSGTDGSLAVTKPVVTYVYVYISSRLHVVSQVSPQRFLVLANKVSGPYTDLP